MSTSDEILARYKRQQRKTVAILLGSLALIVGLVIAFAVVIVATRPDPGPSGPVTYDSYQEAWESTMAKASVEASFPAEPVPLESLVTSGTQTFSAIFTAEELTALMVMHPYDYTVDGTTIALTRPVLDLETEGRLGFTGRLIADGSGYSVVAEVACSYEDGHVVLEPDDAFLKVTGFTLRGERRQQALDGIGEYVDALLDAAPGLTVESAQIVEGGVRVEGTCPISIMLP